MRSEQEMLDLILSFANEEERVRAVVLNGSRANPDAPRDRFQDYDVVFVVSDVGGFVRDRSWIRKQFGDLIIMQTPDENALFPSDRASFAFLMLFEDGNRIDLTFYPADQLDQFEAESLSLVLLDKDGLLGTLPAPSNSDHRTTPPTAAEFDSCCNEFWWVSTYIAKGLWRRELPYAKWMFENPVRNMLTLMLKWHIGVQTNFSADPGKLGKYFQRHLSPAHWNAYVQTFADGDYENIWRSLLVMCDLFRETAVEVARHFDFEYPWDDDRRVTKYLQDVRESGDARALPRDVN